MSLNPESGGLEQIGVFVSRIRGEVFLTESDLRFLAEQGSELALVVVGSQAGFFVRESNGSIQTVRSHEEFPVRPASLAIRESEVAVRPRAIVKKPRRGVPAGVIALGLFPVVALAAVAVFPQRAATPRSIEVHEIDHQLRISWEPAQSAILTIDDAGGRVSIPVYPDQTTVTYVPRGDEIDVGLAGVDESNHFQRVSTHYVGAIGPGR
jgi:hypothetical protein